jgi:hypothetical protein
VSAISHHALRELLHPGSRCFLDRKLSQFNFGKTTLCGFSREGFVAR